MTALRLSLPTLRVSFLVLACVLTFAAGPSAAQVTSHQKVSNTEGGLGDVLDAASLFGDAIAPIGDVDGDGVPDLAVSAHGTDGFTGAVWILLLEPDGTVREARRIGQGEGGFTGTLAGNDLFGSDVAALGDLDGDGIPDLAVGAMFTDDGFIVNSGAVYILFLNADGTVREHREISRAAGGFARGLDVGDSFGVAVAAPGDLDGDGLPELVVGARGDDDGGSNRGAAYVLFLNADGTVRTHQKISGTTGGFTGALDDGDGFGGGAARLGDVDDDGVPDVAVGAIFDDDGGTDRGAIYVLFLNADGTVRAHQKISSTAGGFNGTLDDGGFFGASIAGGYDLDGDAGPDLVAGAPYAGAGGEGVVWVIFLRNDGAVNDSELRITSGTTGFSGALDPGDAFGSGVAVVADLDGDGGAEIVVGASGDDDGEGAAGAVWTLFTYWDALPVELAAFTARADGDAVQLTWSTLSETDNAGFGVEHRAGGAWRTLGWVDGQGTTQAPQRYAYRVASLEPGRHAFRLRQVDRDGRTSYSAVVEAALTLPDAYALGDVYPNPFNPRAQVSLTVREAQPVRATLHDVLGREVAVLFDGVLPAGTTRELSIDASALSSGLYLVRVAGRDFTGVRRALLLK